MPSSDLLQEALDDAFRFHFAKLFEVLMVEASDESLRRFFIGLRNTSKMYDAINKELER